MVLEAVDGVNQKIVFTIGVTGHDLEWTEKFGRHKVVVVFELAQRYKLQGKMTEYDLLTIAVGL